MGVVVAGLKRLRRPADIPNAVIASTKARVTLCEEKQRLRVLYSRAVVDNSRAVNEVVLARGKASKEEYERCRAQGDEARRVLNSARSALEQHKQDHGC